MLARKISAQVVLFRFLFLLIIFVTLTAGRFEFVFKVVVVFLELPLMQNFFFAVLFDAIVF